VTERLPLSPHQIMKRSAERRLEDLKNLEKQLMDQIRLVRYEIAQIADALEQDRRNKEPDDGPPEKHLGS